MSGAAGWDRPGQLAVAATRRGNRAAHCPPGHRGGSMSWWSRVARWGRVYRLDIIWVAFVGVNLAAMQLLPAWQTIPFLAIWVSLTVMYGFRLWQLQPAILTLAVVTLATGGIIG